MKSSARIASALVLFAAIWIIDIQFSLAAPAVDRFEFESPAVVLQNVPFTITISAVDQYGNVISAFGDTLNCSGIWQKQGETTSSISQLGPFEHGKFVLDNAVITKLGPADIQLKYENIESDNSVYVIPGILSILPPVLAIMLALLLRQVVLSLFFGIWLGAMFLNGYNPVIGFLRSLDQYILGAGSDPSNLSIILFTLLLGGMVGIMSRSGGTAGIVKSLSRYARNRRSGQVSTWAMGLFIFFDDYANTLVVGNTMRPLTDKLRISREKLSYIVDSTAAPVAAIAVVSTWVGFQVGLIDSALDTINVQRDAYFVFLQSIGFSFYCIFTLATVFLTGFTGRDFGSMLKAETRAYETGEVIGPGAVPIADTKSMELQNDKEWVPLRWYNAVVPILTMIGVAFVGLYYSGSQALGSDSASANLVQIIGAADPFNALIWGTAIGVFVAGLMAIGQKILNLREVMDGWMAGLKAMLLAIVILVLAWSIGDVCKGLNTAGYVVQITQGLFTPRLLPALTFLVSAIIAFATGTSWATMAILTPLVIPLSYQMSIEAGLSADLSTTILLGTIAAVLSGSVFGDHSSPISDTTIMSSMASGSDHIDHVRTQIPYAFLSGGVALVFGYIPAGFGLHPLILIPLGILVLFLIITFIGKKQEP